MKNRTWTPEVIRAAKEAAVGMSRLWNALIDMEAINYFTGTKPGVVSRLAGMPGMERLSTRRVSNKLVVKILNQEAKGGSL